MVIILPALGVAFFAFGVWLTVRVVNRREPWAKWMAVAMIASLGYPLSFGPACWWFSTPHPSRIYLGATRLRAPRIYWPIGWATKHGPFPFRKVVFWYARIGIPENGISLPTDGTSRNWYDSVEYAIDCTVQDYAP